jgi:hypothetical protein
MNELELAILSWIIVVFAVGVLYIIIGSLWSKQRRLRNEAKRPEQRPGDTTGKMGQPND